MGYDVGQVFLPHDWQGYFIPGHNFSGGTDVFENNDLFSGRPGAPQMGENPYLSKWNSLIGQLEQRGTPLSDKAYQAASDRMLNQTSAMSRSGSAGAARQAGINVGQAQGTLSQNYAQAKIQEDIARQSALQSALGGAGQAWFAPHAANLQAMMNSPTKWQMIMDYMGKVMPALAGMGGGGGAAGAASAMKSGSGQTNWYGPPGGSGQFYGPPGGYGSPYGYDPYGNYSGGY